MELFSYIIYFLLLYITYDYFNQFSNVLKFIYILNYLKIINTIIFYKNQIIQNI